MLCWQLIRVHVLPLVPIARPQANISRTYVDYVGQNDIQTAVDIIKCGARSGSPQIIEFPMYRIKNLIRTADFSIQSPAEDATKFRDTYPMTLNVYIAILYVLCVHVALGSRYFFQ